MKDIEQIKWAAEHYRSKRKESQNLQGKLPLDGSYAEITPLFKDGGLKTFSALYPIEITCIDALPNRACCHYLLLAISVELPEASAKKISSLTVKARSKIKTTLALGCPIDLLQELVLQFLNESSTFCVQLDELIKTRSQKTNSNQIGNGSIVPHAALLNVSNEGMVKILAQTSNSKLKLPSKQRLKYYCNRLHDFFYKTYFYGDHADMHRGWVDCKHFWYFQSQQLTMYKAGNIKDCFPPHLDLSTIPLFSFALFSAVKPFFSNYPARISDCERYCIVQKKLNRVVFLSVTGKYAAEYSTSYCGTSMSDCEVVHPATYRIPNTPYAKRVHDGVIIYERAGDTGTPYVISEKRLPQFLVHDACSLFVNAELPAHEGMVAVSAPLQAPNKNASHLVNTQINTFMGWLEQKWTQKINEAYESYAKALYQMFLRYYKEAARPHFGTAPLLSQELFKKQLPSVAFLSFDGTIRCFIDEFSELDERWLKIYSQPVKQGLRVDKTINTIMKTSKKELRILSGLPHKHRMLTSILIKTPTHAAKVYARFYVSAHELYHKAKAEACFSLFEYGIAEALLTQAQHTDRQAVRNNSFLLASFLSFSEFLSESEPDTSAELKSRAIQAFRKLCVQEAVFFNTENTAKHFCRYLCRLIMHGSIISVRSIAEEGQNVLGWYDGKKELLYLPYATYFEDFCTYFMVEQQACLPYTKASFQQQVLYPFSLVTPAENHTKSKYYRPECKIVVAPIHDHVAKAATVIKVSVPAIRHAYAISCDVDAALYKMRCNTPARRKKGEE